MIEAVEDRIVRRVKQAHELYHRLIILVAPSGSGKSQTLRGLEERLGTALVNVNLELSERLLDLTERQRAIQVPRLLADIVRARGAEVVLLDNLELLFDVGLKQDPLRLLQGLSRNHTIVASWNGCVQGEFLTYAAPDHAEYRKYPARDLLLVDARGVDGQTQETGS